MNNWDFSLANMIHKLVIDRTLSFCLDVHDTTVDFNYFQELYTVCVSTNKVTGH